MGISWKEKFSYGIGAFGKDLVYGLMTAYIVFYLNDVMGISSMFVGSLLLVARVFDAINDPIMGMIVDNTQSKYGKFRPWIFVGTIINAIILVALFYGPSFEGKLLLTYVSAMYILWGITYTIMDIPYWAMIPALTMDQKEREEVAVIPRVFAGVGFTVASSLGIPLVKYFGNGNDEKGFFYLSLIIAVIFITTISITVFNIKERNVVKDREKITIKKMFSTLIGNDQLLVVIVTIVIFNISTYITSNLGIYFFKYDIGNEVLFGIFSGLAGVAQILAMIAFPFLTKKISRKKVFVGGVITSVTGYIILFFASNFDINSMVLLFSAAFFIFIGFGLATILTTVMLADTVEYGEWKFNHRGESVIFSMQTFVVKFSSAISGFVVGAGLSIINFVPNQTQTAETLAGLRFIMIVIPIIGLLISLFVYLKYFKLDKEMYDSIVADIKERRKKKNENIEESDNDNKEIDKNISKD